MRTPKTPDSPPTADPTGETEVAPSVAIPDPIVATDADGMERPLSGGSFVRIDGKLVRQEG